MPYAGRDTQKSLIQKVISKSKCDDIAPTPEELGYFLKQSQATKAMATLFSPNYQRVH